MDTHHLNHDELGMPGALTLQLFKFLAKLGELLTRRKNSDHGAVYLTQKRLTHGQDLPLPTTENPFPDLHPPQPMPVIVRATDGKSREKKALKIKLSTIVQPDDMHEFYTRYADVCKAGMTALKPRDRSKKKAKARRKKATTA